MAMEGDVKRRASSSPSVDSQVPDSIPEALSAEDVDWVDSCLVKDSDSADNWFTMKDAFLEAIYSTSESYQSYEPPRNESPEDTDAKMIPLKNEAESVQFAAMKKEIKKIARSPFDVLLSQEEAESSSENVLDDLESIAFPFLPSYAKGLQETPTNDLESESSSEVNEGEPGTDGIFRVWDLNVPAEENELGKQLKKVMEETDLPFKPSEEAFNGVPRDGLKVESLEDLINAIANISLGQDASS